MPIQTVLTGDLIRSRSVDQPGEFVEALKRVLHEVDVAYGARAETFRGDGFQVVPDRASLALRCAVALRAGLIAKSPPGQRWDARIAIGVGPVDEDAPGFGPAYVLSGQGLDGMKRSALQVFSADADFLERIDLATEFAAAIIEAWTAVEAETYFTHLIGGDSQKDVAEKLGKARVTVNQALKRAQAKLMDTYLERSESLLEARNA
ncbi:MAG: hypothetical protein V4801_25795 [Burkholderia gladioli]